MPPNFYPAKLLLFGEHTVVRGSQALAVPLSKYGGSWQRSADKSRQYDLPKLVDYLKKLVAQKPPSGVGGFDTEGLSAALSDGLYFESNIPRGYGVGSSGALVAAIFDRFCLDKTLTINDLKNVLGLIESFFHGASSGLDPLVSYLKQTVLIKSDKTIETLSKVKNDLPMFLIDTRQPRKTELLVKLFADKCNTTPQYNSLIENELVPFVDDAITAFLTNQTDALFDTLHQISFFQQRFLPEMIPMAFKNLWLEGLAGDVFKLKLCGAGGGGFILGFAKNLATAKAELARSGFSLIECHT